MQLFLTLKELSELEQLAHTTGLRGDALKKEFIKRRLDSLDLTIFGDTSDPVNRAYKDRFEGAVTVRSFKQTLDDHNKARALDGLPPLK
jgi:hypothetical protein